MLDLQWYPSNRNMINNVEYNVIFPTRKSFMILITQSVYYKPEMHKSLCIQLKQTISKKYGE